MTVDVEGIEAVIATKDADTITPPVEECRRPDGKWYTEGDPVVWLPFSAYELANLSAMFQAIWPWRYEREHVPNNPLAVFNSGDWTGVVGDRFVFTAKKYAPGQQGNHSPEEYIKMTKYYGGK